jgi:hypothetical protein
MTNLNKLGRLTNHLQTVLEGETNFRLLPTNTLEKKNTEGRWEKLAWFSQNQDDTLRITSKEDDWSDEESRDLHLGPALKWLVSFLSIQAEILQAEKELSA